jgi:hypothetical protein
MTSSRRTTAGNRLRRGYLAVGGAFALSSMLILLAPEASANPEQDCHKRGGTDSSTAPGDGHVYSACTLGETTIGWKDSKDPVSYSTPK